jgi:4-hydroxyproline epimerase
VLFRKAGGFVPLCGHGIIATATIAIERHLIHPREPGVLTLETAAGMVAVACDVIVDGDRDRVARVRYLSPPSFVYAGAVPVNIGARVVRADIAFGGAEFLLIADSESAGVPLARSHAADLQRAGRTLLASAEASVSAVHPLDPTRHGLAGVVFTGPPEADAHLRCAVIYDDGTLDRSPSGTAVSALLAVFDAMGLAGRDAVTIESLSGTTMRGRIVEHVSIGEVNGVCVEIEGTAWIVAEHEFLIERDDPLAHGIAW